MSKPSGSIFRLPRAGRWQRIPAMKVECPNCSAAFDVPDWMLSGAGRSLRCGMCKTVFASPALPGEREASPPAAQAVPPPEAPAMAPPINVAAEDRPEPLLARDAVADAAPASSTRFLGPAWGVSIAVILLGVVVFFAKRVEIAAAWPPAQRFFAALGMM